MAKKLAVITGDKRLNRALRKLSGPDQKKAIRKAARPAIKPVMQEGRKNAKEHRDSGALDKSIKVRALKRSRSRIGIRVTTRAGDTGDQFYAAFRELGWKAGKAKRQIEGTEDLKRAADEKQRSVLKDYTRRCRKIVLGMAKA